MPSAAHPSLVHLTLLAALTLPLGAEIAVVKPESAGFSSGRLQRIGQSVQRRIAAGEIAGAITAVSRRGQVVHFQTHGLMDLEAKTTVALLGSAHVADTLPGRTPGTGYGIGVRVITDRGAAGTMLSVGSYGWSGAFGTLFWVDPKVQLVGLIMFQLQSNYADIRSDFETTVMQAMLRE